MKKIIKKSKNKPASNSKKEKKKILRNKRKIKSKKSKTNQKISILEKNIENNQEDIISIKRLIRTIFNIREARRQLCFLGIDLKNSSLKINDNFFKACCNKLEEIDKVINNKDNHKVKKEKFFELTKQYYKIFPHSFPFPDYSMYLINDINKIKREICLLELVKSYDELGAKFQKIKKESSNKEENELNNSMNLNDSINLSINNMENASEEEQHHTIISDKFFEKAVSQFNYNITLVDKNNDDFIEIDNYLNLFSTKNGGPYPPLELIELFQLKKIGDENKTKNSFYWYGCEITHFYSILRYGFRNPIKEAPKNAFIYGKGILLSQNAYSQIQKCLPKNNIVYLFICTVDNLKAKTVHLHHKNYPEELKKEFNSIRIKTKILKLSDDSSEEDSNDDKSYINSEDYIIYNPSSIRIHFIAKIQIP